MSAFTEQLDKAYEVKVVQRLEAAVRFLSLAFYGSVKLMTPVDTGRARGNWGMQINTIDISIVEPNSPKDDSGIVVNYKLDNVINISNNLPYIKRLNEGYSGQAPAGFVEDAILSAKDRTNRKYK